jgi:hypothetical protein
MKVGMKNHPELNIPESFLEAAYVNGVVFTRNIQKLRVEAQKTSNK